MNRVNLHNLFSTKERENILRFILKDWDKIYSVRTTSKILNLSPGIISKYFKLLKEKGFLKDINRKYVLNKNNPELHAIKLVFNLQSLNVKPLKNIETIKGIGLYGSWAKGINDEKSDIDVWIKVSKHPGEEMIAKLSGKMSRSIGHNFQILILYPERLERLKKEDPIFYYSLVYNSIVLCGEPIEA